MKGAIRVRLLLFIVCVFGCHSGGPERVIAQIDGAGNLTFAFSHTGRPAMLLEFSMRRSADGEVVCMVEAASAKAGTSSAWHPGEKPGSGYRVEGCNALEAGVYRVEFRAHKYGEAFAYGVCDVCVDSDGKMSFGKAGCNKGTCKSSR